MMPGPLWNEQEQEAFVNRLKASSTAVFAYALHQSCKGKLVEIPPVVVSPRADQNLNHTDGGDLFVVIKHRFEIKHRKRRFTSAADWPDPHVFVSNVGTIDRANGETYAHVIVNLDMTHAAVISRATQDKWYVMENQPSNTTVPEKVYCCPKELVQFIELERP